MEKEGETDLTAFHRIPQMGIVKEGQFFFIFKMIFACGYLGSLSKVIWIEECFGSSPPLASPMSFMVCLEYLDHKAYMVS